MADTQPLAPTDAELTAIYKAANGEDTGKAQPLTTQHIFRAMRAAIAKWGAQPVVPAHSGEPDAWLTRDDEGSPAMLFFDRAEALQYCEYDESPEPLRLDGQPTVREPLTREQLYVLMETTGGDVYSLASANNVIDFARAVERAHGIKGGQHGAE